MIKEIQKDVTTVEKGVILHSVNAMGVMGSGVALAIKNKWPKVNSEYVELYNFYKDQPWQLMGGAQRVEINPNLSVVNLFGQFDIGTDYRRTEYGSIHQALKRVRYRYLNDKIDIYIPYKMGCDRGGGDWNIVYDIIKTLLDNDNRTIYICRL
jgi:O-acetyl-ADP-ribose deacetylase (regulator of RNase III)